MPMLDREPNTLPSVGAPKHPRLQTLIASARSTQPVGVVYPCDALALQAARAIADGGLARPVLVGPAAKIIATADTAGIQITDLEIDAPVKFGSAAASPAECADHAAQRARDGKLTALMKGALHTDELMGAVVRRVNGLRTERRISHVFVFDLPRYHKFLALADCVVNIAPGIPEKLDILTNAIHFLRTLDVTAPKVAVVTAVEVVQDSIPATLDAAQLVKRAKAGQWPGAVVEGPFGFDNAFSAEAARIKGLQSLVAGDADLMLMPDLNAGNMLYKSFVYVAGGECAGLVLGARVPIILNSRSAGPEERKASAAIALLNARKAARPK